MKGKIKKEKIVLKLIKLKRKMKESLRVRIKMNEFE